MDGETGVSQRRQFPAGRGGDGPRRRAIEGVDFAILDEEFDLKAQGYYTSLVVVPVGHHSVEDFNATLPKSRLPQSTTITEI